MAIGKEFKEDKPRSGLLSKLFLTRLQRRSLLKWVLYALVLLLLSVTQDVLLSRFRLFGATTELVIVGIFLISLAEGSENGSVFSLVASCLYLFSGSAAGYYSIVLITGLSVVIMLFRQSYLRKGFAASMLCTVFAVMMYEVVIFFLGLFLEKTLWSRLGTYLLVGIYSLAFAPVLYPVIRSISNIGGDVWKE